MPRLLHELAVGRGDGSYTRLLARLAKLDLLAIDDWMLAPLRGRRTPRPHRDHRGPCRTCFDPDRQPVARHRLARRHRRPQLGRRDLRPTAPRRAPHRAQGPLDATDTPHSEDSRGGDEVSRVSNDLVSAWQARHRERRQAGESRVRRRAGGTVATTPPRRAAWRFAPTGVGSAATTTKSASSPRTAARVESQVTVANRMGGTDRSTSLRSDERSTSPKSVFHIPGMRVPLHRNTQPSSRTVTVSARVGDRRDVEGVAPFRRSRRNQSCPQPLSVVRNAGPRGSRSARSRASRRGPPPPAAPRPSLANPRSRVVQVRPPLAYHRRDGQFAADMGGELRRRRDRRPASRPRATPRHRAAPSRSPHPSPSRGAR